MSNWRDLWEIVFWVSGGILAYIYVGYPILLLLLSCVFHRQHAKLGYTPFLSVLITAYNERVNIRRKIEHTLGADYPPECLEVVVASDGSTDGTDEIARSIEDPRVKVIRVEGRRGKTYAQNEAVKHCKGQVIVFSDATTIYHRLSLRYLAANYQDSRVGAVSGRYQYLDTNGASPTGLGTITFWNYENLIKRFQSKIKTISGCCGCIYSVRKAAYTELADDVISDLVQPLHVIKKGFRVVFEERALAFEETTQSAEEEFKMRVRVVTRGMRGILSVPELLLPWKHGWVSFQLISHKVLRWLVGIFLLAILVSNAFLIGRPFFMITMALQACFYATALLALVSPLHRRWKVLAIPLYFCILNVAAVVSLGEILRGRKYVVWETVRT